MKRILLALILLACASPAAAWAQQTPAAPGRSHVQAAEQLLLVMESEQNLRKSMDRMMEVQVQQNPMLASMQDILKEFYARHLTWEKMKPEMLNLYVSNFTEAEIRQLTAFYQTEIGRKMVEKMPEITARSAEISQRLLQPHLPEMTQRIMTRMQEDPEAMRRTMEQQARQMGVPQPEKPAQKP